MNQFAQLLSAQRQTPVLLDTCTIISAWEKRPEALELRKKIAKRNDIRIIVPGILVREVAKVARLGQDQALALIESFSEMGQIDYVTKCGDDDNRITREAEALIAKYPRYSHFPDNQYLAYCRDQGALLVTYDKNLRTVARIEGIMACAPGNFRLYN